MAVPIPHPRSRGRQTVPSGVCLLCGHIEMPSWRLRGLSAGAAPWGVLWGAAWLVAGLPAGCGEGDPAGFDRWPVYKGTRSEASERSPAGRRELGGQFRGPRRQDDSCLWTMKRLARWPQAIKVSLAHLPVS